jgi:hypothetical protein
MSASGGKSRQRCTARYTPAEQLDQLVWSDLSNALNTPSAWTKRVKPTAGGRCKLRLY